MSRSIAEPVYKGYGMIYDHHTHTVYSHGKGSIEDNVQAARRLGLRSIAISDHGPGHLTYGMKRESVPVMRREIKRLNELYDDIDVFYSVEANITLTGNHLDVSLEEFSDYDFIIAGYHYGIKNGNCLTNFACSHAGGIFKNRLLVSNTDMTVKALYENDIRILTHPGDKGPFDIKELARACADTGTLMEISTWHGHLTAEEIRICAESGAEFIISSDAHTPARVGDAAAGIRRAEEAGLPLSRIVNVAEKEEITE